MKYQIRIFVMIEEKNLRLRQIVNPEMKKPVKANLSKPSAIASMQQIAMYLLRCNTYAIWAIYTTEVPRFVKK